MALKIFQPGVCVLVYVGKSPLYQYGCEFCLPRLQQGADGASRAPLTMARAKWLLNGAVRTSGHHTIVVLRMIL